ncbi:heterokaryon incompatibility protein-domain-containing protein, partial [Rhexocercosporidium sp. MPI-PUGE-AT-0058]
MRLLNTITRELEEFYHDIPEYAILSHTWDEKELLFDDLKHSNPKGLPGFEKVDRCCKLAAGRGFEYVWIDTCCIDKNSSAELQEAINSMYRWYKNAEVCFAYLSDVPSSTNPARTGFATSLWFTRGWTLQELIAPRIVEFYGRNEDGEWGEIGTKSSLRDVVAEITGVPIAVLKTGSLANLSVATRMSWASRRQTKREEDRAYSLMGIFDVHMTMVYGEGKRAFGRLQEEIMKVSNDHSLFAWSSPKRHIRHWTGQGLLADSPADFFHSGQYHCSEHSEGAAAYQITNVGLRVQFPLVP